MTSIFPKVPLLMYLFLECYKIQPLKVMNTNEIFGAFEGMKRDLLTWKSSFSSFWQIDQPDLALPRVMYVEPNQYGEYLQAYKTFMLETAIIMSR